MWAQRSTQLHINHTFHNRRDSTSISWVGMWVSRQMELTLNLAPSLVSCVTRNLSFSCKVRVTWSIHPVGSLSGSGLGIWHLALEFKAEWLLILLPQRGSQTQQRFSEHSPEEAFSTGNESGGICRASSAIALFENVQENIQTDKS